MWKGHSAKRWLVCLLDRFLLDEVSVSGLELSHAPTAPADTIREPSTIVLLAGEQADEAEDLAQNIREGILEVSVCHDIDERVEG